MGVLSALRGRIEARYVAVFRVCPSALRELAPEGLTPRVHNGVTPVGLCYTQLESVQSRLLPNRLASNAEHLAWRVPVDRADGSHAVWIPRRHTSSWLSAHCSGVLSGGGYTHARFRAELAEEGIALSVESREGEVLHLRAVADRELRGSMFATTRQAQELLDDSGSVHPPDPLAPALDRLGLSSGAWTLLPMSATEVRAPKFEDAGPFAAGSAEFDCILRLSQHAQVGAARPARALTLEEFEASAVAS